MRRHRFYGNSPCIDFVTNNHSFNKYPLSIYACVVLRGSLHRESNREHETSKISCNTERKRRRALGKREKKLRLREEITDFCLKKAEVVSCHHR